MIAVGPARLTLSWHAVRRYQERVRPASSLLQCESEIERLLAGCDLSSERPAWARGDTGAEAWIVVADSIAFPVRGGRIMTCLVRAEVGAQVRVVRAERRQAKRRPGARKKHGKVARSERARRDAARADEQLAAD